MNRDEVKTEVAHIINEQLDAMNEVDNVAGLILDFLDSIGYDYDPEAEAKAESTYEKVLREFG